MITLAILCGLLVVFQEKKLIMVMSAIGGAYASFAGADHFVKSGYVDAIHVLLIQEELPSSSDYKVYVDSKY